MLAQSELEGIAVPAVGVKYWNKKKERLSSAHRDLLDSFLLSSCSIKNSPGEGENVLRENESM